MSSYSSDQTTLNLATIGADTLSRAGRARVTSIQGKGNASGSIILRTGGATGTVIATYLFGTEGLSEYVPGSGILFVEGVHATIAGTVGVTITFT